MAMRMVDSGHHVCTFPYEELLLKMLIGRDLYINIALSIPTIFTLRPEGLEENKRGWGG